MLKTLVKLGLTIALALLVGGVCLFLVRAKRLGQFDSGVGITRELVSSEADFARAHPGTGYTCVLSELPRSGMTPKISERGESLYYSVEIKGCRVGQPGTAFQLLVRPRAKGHAAFCADQSGVVKYDSDGSAEMCLQTGTPIG
jgi:hypothetical protein